LDNQGNRVADPALTTDENGLFSLNPSAQRGYLFRVRHEGHEIASAGDIWVYDWQQQRNQRPQQQTIFFTDRSIYRPGQTIQYKGIALSVDQEKDNYEVLKGENVTVMFRDVQRFMWLIKHQKDPTDPRGLYHVDSPQRALDGLNKGATVADKLAESGEPPASDRAT
jgi:hypothetical protein